MEKRLKHERNKLFLRIIIILSAVWLMVSLVFCGVRLSVEKVNIQNSELAELSVSKQILTVGNGSLEAFSSVLSDQKDFTYKESGDNAFDTQAVFTDDRTDAVIADTAGSIAVPFRVKDESDGNYSFFGLLYYDALRGSLSDEQFGKIEKYLNTDPGGGNYYELICTKLGLGVIIKPVELKIVLVDGSDTRFVIDGNVATYKLNCTPGKESDVYSSSEISRNTIPKGFLLNKEYNRDIIGQLTKQERKANVDMIHSGGLNYIFYAQDYLSFNGAEYADGSEKIVFQYAKEVNLFDNCKRDLALGAAVIFVFFLTIALILCVMIWRTVKAQIIQEQKRLDLTNALAHDIKTPLFVISGYAYTLKEDIDADERGEYIDKIIEQTDEVNGLVHRMLSYSKLDSYQMKLNKTELDLLELTKSILKNYTALPYGKKLEFVHSGRNIVEADRELLKTALQNLIDNAVKYALPDTVVKVGLNGTTFTVSNEAEPLSKSDIKEIWQPYVRKDKSRTTKGNGLGLSIVKSILDLHKAGYGFEYKDGRLNFTAKL